MSIPTTFDIEHKCGHEETRDLSDIPAGQRAGKVDWLKTRPCFNCFRASSKRKVSKELKAEWDQLHQEAVEDQERSGLPLLRGSDKQVKWAIDCRFKLLRDGYDALAQEGDLDDDAFDEQVLELARRIDLAKWWIDK